ncbi:XVIPCD domain-containing protein [Xanthomonas citri]|uniref:XVIPCD domain-containing protein n=1 Tax=Xanthomonas citri TaxID=346 RepID=UPI0015E17012|nr:XVIPCD domain-containing protein [Xanthomonas citri]
MNPLHKAIVSRICGELIRPSLGHWAPASGRQLDESVQPAVPGLGNSGRAFSAGGAPLDPQQEARLRDDPLFKQALAGLDKLGPDAGVYTNQQDKERIAGALAVQAKLNLISPIAQP